MSWLSGAWSHRGTWRLVGVLAVVGSLSGCWQQIGFGPEHRRYNDVESGLTVDNVASLTRQWSFPRILHFDEPIQSDGRVFVRGQAEVIAVDADDGSVLWERRVPNDSPLAMSGGVLWTSEGEVLAPPPNPQCSAALLRLDPATGVVVGEDPGIVTGPVVTGGSIVTYAQQSVSDLCDVGNWSLVVRDSDTLDVRWSYTFPVGSNSDLMPTVLDDVVYITHESLLYAFPVDCGQPCQPLWTYDVGGIPSRHVVAGFARQLFVHRPGAEIAVLAADTGALLWTIDATGDMAIAGDRLYLATLGELWVFDANGCGSAVCTPLWTVTLLDATHTGRPVVAGGAVYVTGNDRRIHAVDAAGCGASLCEPLVSVPTGNGAAVQLVVSGGALFAINDATTTANYELVAYRPS